MTAKLKWRGFEDFAKAELYEVLRFRQRIFVVEQRCPYADLDGLDENADHLTLHVDNELAGYLRIVPLAAPQSVRIGRVAVAAPRRGAGLAHLLMNAALDRVRQTTGRPVTLAAQAYLVGFYAGLGFVPVSPPYDDDGIPHVEMRWP